MSKVFILLLWEDQEEHRSTVFKIIHKVEKDGVIDA